MKMTSGYDETVEIDGMIYRGDIEREVRPESIRYAGNQLAGVNDKLDVLRETDYMFPSHTISICQECIETSVKAMFKLLGVNPPDDTHSISLEDSRTKKLILANYPGGFDESRIPRAIFFTQIWRQYYEVAKYGIPERNLNPEDVIRNEDAKLALKHANFCEKVAVDLSHSLREDRREQYNSDDNSDS